MWSRVTVLLAVATAVRAQWPCTASNVEAGDVEDCCPDEAKEKVEEILDKYMNMEKAAIAIQTFMENKFGGPFWETVVGTQDLGYATFTVEGNFCKHSAAGKTALTWKPMEGGGGGDGDDGAGDGEAASGVRLDGTVKLRL